MQRFSITAGATLFAVLIALSPAWGQTVVTQLTTGALLGPSSSSTELANNVRAHTERLATAAMRLGMSSAETAAMFSKIERRQYAWVEVPRRLDGMAWLHRGRVRVLRNVIIPAGSYGWEIDIGSPGSRVRAFLPKACGNLSLIRTTVLAARVAPPPHAAPAPAATAVPFDVRPVPIEAIDVPAPAPFVPALPSIVAPAVAHSSHFPWLLLLPLGFFLVHGGSGTSMPPVATIPTVPAGPPAPPPPSTYTCWEEPSPTCDSAQSIIRH
ncbi:MAG TPA: hypothetical protein VIG51_02735 [Candidatus Baltobacteraceae bacterium]|jgi:hypothetical protein